MAEPDALRPLARFSQDGIAVVGSDGCYRFVDRDVESTLGYVRDDLCGRAVLSYVHPEDRDRVRDRFDAVANSGERPTVRYRHRTRDGSWVWLQSLLSSGEEVGIDGSVVASRDVTDRVEAETRLRELATNSPDVLWTFTGEWDRLLFVNRAFEPIYGMSVEALEADPRRFLECVHPEDVPRVEAAMARASAGDSVTLEYRVNPSEDYRRWVWVQAEPVVEDGQVARIVGFSRDVTGRHRRTRHFAVMDNLLRHNIRNDVNAITGNAELVADRAGADVADLAETIIRVATGLIDTAGKQREVIDLLKGEQSPRTVDLCEQARRVVDGIRASHPEATVETDIPRSARAVTLPAFDRALEELLTNAIEHAPASGPRVRLSIEPRPGRIDVTVADDNPRIPEYEFLVMTDDAGMEPVGHPSGMGLWLVYWVVELSDGDLSVTAGEGDGNVVRLALPRAGAGTADPGDR